jgi:KUP system potassium uptake protein
MAKQAIQLGFLPRMAITYTSSREIGQIYVPMVNWLLLAGVAAVVLGFGSSSALASAYGVAVTSTMLITTILTFYVVRDAWRLPRPVAWLATAFFVALDVLLVASCMAKLFDGGWLPLVLALVLFTVMSTWKRGRAILLDVMGKDDMRTEVFIASMRHAGLPRAERTAVFMVANPETVPQALLHNLKHNQILHHKNILLTVRFRDVPWVGDSDRLAVKYLGDNFWAVEAIYGFMDTPDVPKALELAAPRGLEVPYFETSFFLSRESVVSTKGTGMAQWREHLFIAMQRNAGSAADYFKLPNNAIVEMGTRVQI